MSPKSITPERVPSEPTRFAGWRSPCTHSGGPSHSGAATASSQIARTSSASSSGTTAWKKWSNPSVCFLGWPPRSSLTGASWGAATWRAVRKPARAPAAWSPRLRGVESSGSPGTQVTMVQGLGKRAEGSPVRTGRGTGSGRRGARTGSQRHSLRRRSGAPSVRGMRTARASPRRHIWLPHPPATSRTASPARSGCCSRSRSRTRSAVISISEPVMRSHPTGAGLRPRS